MATEIVLVHVLPCTPSQYWELCVLDAEYGRQLFVDALGFRRYDVVRQSDAVHTVDREVLAEPNPAGVPAIARAGLAYRELGRLDRTRSEYVFMTSHPGAASVKTLGRIVCRPSGEVRCERRVEMQIKVGIPVVGPMLEGRIARNARKAYDMSAAFTAAWVGARRA